MITLVLNDENDNHPTPASSQIVVNVIDNPPVFNSWFVTPLTPSDYDGPDSSTNLVNITDPQATYKAGRTLSFEHLVTDDIDGTLNPTYNWTSPSGNISDDISQSGNEYTLLTEGTYTLQLSVVDSNGQLTDTNVFTIVALGNQPPQINGVTISSTGTSPVILANGQTFTLYRATADQGNITSQFTFQISDVQDVEGDNIVYNFSITGNEGCIECGELPYAGNDFPEDGDDTENTYFSAWVSFMDGGSEEMKVGLGMLQ